MSAFVMYRMARQEIFCQLFRFIVQQNSTEFSAKV